MALTHDSAPPPPPERISLLYTIGVPIVFLLDGALALLLGIVRAKLAANQDVAEAVGYTIGYGGCSFVFCFGIVLGLAVFIARNTSRPVRPLFLKIAFWSGLTWVPLFMLLLGLSAALRSVR